VHVGHRTAARRTYAFDDYLLSWRITWGLLDQYNRLTCATTASVSGCAQGTMSPGGPLGRTTEPSLLLIPATADAPNGTLLAVAGGSSATQPGVGRALVLRRSLDGGATWGPTSFPFGPFADPKTVGSFFQNQLTWDDATGTAFITIGNITTHTNACGNGGSMEELDGLLQITSTDRGNTWSAATNVGRRFVTHDSCP
jgi:hypothetical protein